MTRQTASPRTPLIHIGMPKTATKTLQWRLFSAHEEIHYLGRFDGPHFRQTYSQFNACRNAQVQQLMREIAYDKVRNPDFAKCSRLIQDILQPANEAGLVPVWSWESYSTDTLLKRQWRARNLKRVFDDANILMTVRHPIHLLESAYLQMLNRDNAGARASIGRFPVSLSINDWLKREWERDVRFHLEYDKTIQAYIDEFGRERVHVQAFELLRHDSDAFFTGICRILGVSVERGLQLVRGEKDNTAWSQENLDALRSISTSPWAALKFTFSPRDRRRQLLGLDRTPEEKGVKARLDMTDEWRKRIIAQTRDANEWLMRTFSLPLDEYGYLEDR